MSEAPTPKPPESLQDMKEELTSVPPDALNADTVQKINVNDIQLCLFVYYSSLMSSLKKSVSRINVHPLSWEPYTQIRVRGWSVYILSEVITCNLCRW